MPQVGPKREGLPCNENTRPRPLVCMRISGAAVHGTGAEGPGRRATVKESISGFKKVPGFPRGQCAPPGRPGRCPRWQRTGTRAQAHWGHRATWLVRNLEQLTPRERLENAAITTQAHPPHLMAFHPTNQSLKNGFAQLRDVASHQPAAGTDGWGCVWKSVAGVGLGRWLRAGKGGGRENPLTQTLG